MKNGYTPREFAHAKVVDFLAHMIRQADHEMHDLTDGEKTMVIKAMAKLRGQIADQAKLDYLLVNTANPMRGK
jgi:hypothetical protein